MLEALSNTASSLLQAIVQNVCQFFLSDSAPASYSSSSSPGSASGVPVRVRDARSNRILAYSTCKLRVIHENQIEENSCIFHAEVSSIKGIDVLSLWGDICRTWNVIPSVKPCGKSDRRTLAEEWSVSGDLNASSQIPVVSSGSRGEHLSLRSDKDSKSIQHVPKLSICVLPYALDATASSVTVGIRIQSVAHGWFVAAGVAHGEQIGANRRENAGRDMFFLEYHPPTRSARLREAHGSYVSFDEPFSGFCANSTWDSSVRISIDEVTDKRIDAVLLRTRKGYFSANRNGRIVIRQDTAPRRQEYFLLRLALPSKLEVGAARLTLLGLPGGVRQVFASIGVPVKPEDAYKVLCDYNQFHTFMRSASDSKILERTSDSTLVVRMVQSHSFLILTINLAIVLDVLEEPHAMRVGLTLRHGTGVRIYKGKWTVTSAGNGNSIVNCELTVASSIPAPGFLLDGVVSHGARESLEDIRAECMRRANAG